MSSQRVRKPSSPAGRTDTLAIDTHRSLLHLGIGDAELDDCLAQQLERFTSSEEWVGLRHDLDERHTAAVVVDEGAAGADDPPARTADVDRLRRILLEMRAHDRPRGRPRRPARQGSAHAQRLVVLEIW